jgi:hypothetical protein
MPVLKKQFLYADEFAKTSVSQLFPSAKWKAAHRLYANHFANTVFLNQGNLQFEPLVLPGAAQFTSLRTSVAQRDSTGIGLLHLGNFYEYNVEIGRQDAGEGLWIQYRVGKEPKVDIIKNFRITGQVRKILPIHISGKQAYILAKNNDSWQIIRHK